MRTRTIFTANQIREAVGRLAFRIYADYTGGGVGMEELVVVPVLDGAMVFASDLVRLLDPLNVVIRPIKLKSYDGFKSSGVVLIDNHFDRKAVEGKHVLVVEDILDTGRTLQFLSEFFGASPKSLRTVALLDKDKAGFHATYTGLKCPDKFVIGYGLDFDGRFRHLPDVVEVLT